MVAHVTSVSFEVFGKVQGVYFRKYTQAKAKELGLTGWVQNTQTGSVIGVIHGLTENLERMADWLQNVGSPKSKISHAKLDWQHNGPSPTTSFVIKR
mmetsp:Transcript_56742/g.130291  ORF Transcript_56742/g.130291 Transcript_56742/m.130291 type:complete len:97 (-) Transcript_56742:320-610(-)